jgi:hypothetical protein
MATAVVLSLLAVCSCLLVEGYKTPHLEDLRFREWYDKYRDALTEQRLDPMEIYPNWLQNAKFVDQHNSFNLQYEVELNVFAYKVTNEECASSFWKKITPV